MGALPLEVLLVLALLSSALPLWALPLGAL